ncbi:reverse transcriptase domain-containing protein [Tanacetum coccineum]
MSTPVPRRFRWEIVYPPPGPKWFINPKTGYRMKRTAYRRRVHVTTHPFRAKEKLPEKPLDDSAPDEETDSDLDSTAKSEAKPKDLEDTFTNNVNNANANGGNGNGGNGNGGNGGNNGGCTYKEFLACKPREFDGKGGVIVLTRWIEKMESVMDISGCVNNQKEEFKALLVEEFCPSNEMENIKTKFWNHVMVGANHAAYTDRSHELAKFVSTLATIQSAILKAGTLTDEAVRCRTLSKSVEKRKETERSSKQGGSVLLIILKVDLVGCVTTFKNQVTLEEIVKRQLSRWRQLMLLEWVIKIPGTMEIKQEEGLSIADFSFISTKFMPLLNVKPSILRPGYVIEVANGKKIETDRIIHWCILELGDSLFTIHLIPFGHGSFDVIIGMDWLSKHKAKIVCHEKVVRIPLLSGKVLRVQGDRTEENPKSVKGKKSDEPKLGDILIVRDFPEVFPKDLSGLPPQRQVEFRID